MDGLQWDALAPCLRPASVDVIISDLPFGKRSGSKADNRVLYPATLLAMARLVRPTTGIVLGYLKGPSHEIYRHKFTEQGLSKGRGWFLNFLRGSDDFIIPTVHF